MLRYAQKPAVGYPTFPGNIEALSIPSSSPERSHESTSTTTATPTSLPPSTIQHSETSPKTAKCRRRQTLAACRPCRKRKSRQCDGARPRCNTCLDKATPCNYSVEEGKTQQQASREELRAYKTVVRMLRKASATDTTLILTHLKTHDDVNEAVKFILEDTRLHGSAIMTCA